MKIHLPNPDDYVDDIMGFLDQMELCVHHARKSAEKTLAKYEDSEDDKPWIALRIPAFDEGSELSKALEEADPDRSIEKEIVLSIEEL